MPGPPRAGLPRPLVIYCADIGSVAKGRFGWARQPVDRARARLTRGTDIGRLAEAVATDLNRGAAVTLGFECPLFVPVPDDPARLTSARRGEGNRAWSAAAGAGALVAGLTEVVWILRDIRGRVQPDIEAFLAWPAFCASRSNLFVWEAFVTSRAKGASHARDAEIAVRSFAACLPHVVETNAIRESAVHSLIGAALLSTGWSQDLALLRVASVVIKA